MIQAQSFLCASFKGFGLVLAIPADDDGVPDLARRAWCRQTAQLLGADRYQFMPFKQRVNLRGQFALSVITAADTQQAGTAQQSHAIARAISIICVKVSLTAWLPKLSPVKGLSEMVSKASAFLPAAAALR